MSGSDYVWKTPQEQVPFHSNFYQISRIPFVSSASSLNFTANTVSTQLILNVMAQGTRSANFHAAINNNSAEI